LTLSPPKIILKLLNHPKKLTYHTVHHAHFLVTAKSLPDATSCFTDGSMLQNIVGFACLIGDKTSSCRHRNIVSIFIAELQAIFHCPKEILTLPFSHSQSFLICSDSLSSLTAITNIYSTHPFVNRIHMLLYTFSTIKVTISLSGK